MTDPPIARASPAGHCLNCGHRFEPVRLNYCPACGQETRVQAPTLLEFAQQFGGSYIAAEGALWRTLRLLLLRPGELTREYLQGRRRRYVLPLRLYLTVSVLVLLLFRSLAVVDIGGIQERIESGKPVRSVTVMLGVGSAGLKDGVFFCHDLPAWACKRLQNHLSTDPKTLAHQINSMGENALAHLGSAMFVLLPAFALWLRLAYFNRGLRYTEHLVFALHLHALLFLMLALLLLDQAWINVAVGLACVVYSWMALRRVYGGRRWPRLLRWVLVLALYGVSLALASVALTWWSLLF